MIFLQEQHVNTFYYILHTTARNFVCVDYEMEKLIFPLRSFLDFFLLLPTYTSQSSVTY